MIDAPSIDVFPNPALDRERPYGEEEREVVSLERHREVAAEIARWPGYAPTPLVELPGLAREVGVGSILYKDESARFGLGSFKAPGGAYGVLHVLRRRVEPEGIGDVTSEDLRAGRHADVVSDVTVTCATDGNHGRAVAWGAELFGCRAVIFIPDHVSAPREAAIAGHGAEVIRVDGSYDDAVRRAAEEAGREERIVVSDTSWPGYEAVPRVIMQGYTVLVAETLHAVESEGAPLPTHVFVQGGVGGLAAAVCGHLWESFEPRRPRLVVVEPREADCLLQSARAGRPATARGSLETVMGCLSCAEPSREAWRIVGPGADAFVAIPDDAAVRAMRTLARPPGDDPPRVAGESGAAGLGGLLAAMEAPEAREGLELDEAARILVVGTEGATDPERYRELVGTAPGEVR